MQSRFEEVITTRERLRELHGKPGPASSNKVIDHIDDICRRFIAACPFVMVATRGADGRLDLSPKGDPAGFVTILDDKTLAIPDRLGNNRLDTFRTCWLFRRSDCSSSFPETTTPCVSVGRVKWSATVGCRAGWR